MPPKDPNQSASDMDPSLQRALRSDPPCFPRACAIQSCLQKNQYDEQKCTKLVDALYECCAALYAINGDDTKSVCCPKPSLLRIKMEQRSNTAGDAELLQGKRR
ncbi:hypothetical protein DFH27DRAFT_538226 [Peziza echinospora]|nr:hypothetical protein DFH27DRAFT_538226 [Peziza echinospora]